MALVPVLFAAGVVFGYFVALPRAVELPAELQRRLSSTSSSRRATTTASSSCSWRSWALVFQIPVGVLALTRTGVVTARLLWRRQGYVILGISVLAAVATPTPDPVTMLVTMAPLVLLYELSIGLAWIFRPRGGSIASRWEDWWEEDDEDEGEGDDEPAAAGEPGAPDERTPVS